MLEYITAKHAYEKKGKIIIKSPKYVNTMFRQMQKRQERRKVQRGLISYRKMTLHLQGLQQAKNHNIETLHSKLYNGVVIKLVKRNIFASTTKIHIIQFITTI